MDRRDSPREANPEWLSLEDLAQIVCEGNIEGELQDRVARVLRSDPRFARQFEELEAMTAAAGAEDLWEGLERHQEFELLLADDSWEDPTEVLNPEGNDLYQVSYRKLLAIAESRLVDAADPARIRGVRDRLVRAQRKPIRDAVFQVAEAIDKLSPTAVEEVLAEVRREWLEAPREDG